jgi:serine/threonine-protein phosphatase 2A regulatory subunit A
MNSAGTETDQVNQQMMMEELDELDQISRVALLIDDLSNEDPSAKLHSIKRLTQIATLLGPERCIEELIPMITELVDKIDNNPELMMNLAEQLGKLSDFLGPDSNSVHLLRPLESILPADDSIVREKAVESLKIVGRKISQQSVFDEYMPMVKRMRKGDLFSMRISACFLYA